MRRAISSLCATALLAAPLIAYSDEGRETEDESAAFGAGAGMAAARSEAEPGAPDAR